MSTIKATIQELSQKGQFCTVLKARASRAGVYKALKHLKESTREKIKRNPVICISRLASEL